jgi:hypothetical protein
VTEDDAPPQVTRVGAYAVCVDETSRLLLCRVAPFARSELPTDRMVGIAELAARLVL